MPQIKKITETLKYAKDAEENWESLAERMRKKGTDDQGPHLPPGVVEITFYECPDPLQKRPYAGPYEICLYSERHPGKAQKILEGNCSGDGNPVNHKLNPGNYVIRIPGRDVSEDFTIYEVGSGREPSRIAT